MKLRYFWLIFLGVLAIGGSACSGGAEGPDIRIAILKGQDEAVISIRDAYQIIDPATGEELDAGRRLQKSKVKVVNDAIVIGKDLFHLKRLRISAKKDISVYLDDKRMRYRGSIDFSADKNGKLLLINTLDMETYVKGVLYHEVSHRWPMEAMKAQAVAARTYALYQIQVNKKQAFDVTNDVYSQMYGGKSAERYRTNIAVDRTRGEVMTYDGKILPAYYHSNSGGHTEDVRELWKHDLPPLYGKPDEYAVDMPNFNWKRNFQSKAFQGKLNDAGHKIGAIKEIRPIEKTKSGRVKMLAVEDRAGKIIKIAGLEFRKMLGVNDIKSSLFDVEMQGYFFDVLGHGWGHGVGMSQWGAYAMAVQRFKYKAILEYYYPGVAIQKIDYNNAP